MDKQVANYLGLQKKEGRNNTTMNIYIIIPIFGVPSDNSSHIFGDQRESMKRGQLQLAQGLSY
ncbi:hypothetical protein GCM10020331_002270 [Ectobacillus funiculus]